MNNKKDKLKWKKTVNINLPIWHIELINKMDSNRSRFIRNLFWEMTGLKRGDEKILHSEESLMQLDRTLNDCRGHDYTYNKERDTFATSSVRMKKHTISVSLDHFIIEIVDRIEPNRSLFFTNLIASKIRKDLLNVKLINNETLINNNHGQMYIKYFKKCS